MRHWQIAAPIAVAAVVLIYLSSSSRRSEKTRWKHRFGAIGSPLIGTPTYRILFFVVVVGILLIALLPEAAFVLPALDAIGWDIATIFVALELGRYLGFLARVVSIPPLVAGYGRGAAEGVRQCRDVIRANPVLWLYACVWPLIAIRTLMGTMRVPPRAQI